MILGNDNWPVGKVCEMIPHFDPDAEVFYSRVKLYHRMLGSPNWQGYSNPLFFSTVGPSGRVGLQASVDGKNIIYPASDNTANPFQVTSMWYEGTEDALFEFANYFNSGKKRGAYLFGTKEKIYGKGDYGTLFRMYKLETYYYTCISRDYRIGDDQVYVADKDLILRENVKLTVPEGSVLCVKNGPFYVNGEIECYGTILVEDGGIIMPMESTSGGRVLS